MKHRRRYDFTKEITLSRYCQDRQIESSHFLECGWWRTTVLYVGGSHKPEYIHRFKKSGDEKGIGGPEENVGQILASLRELPSKSVLYVEKSTVFAATPNAGAAAVCKIFSDPKPVASREKCCLCSLFLATHDRDRR